MAADLAALVLAAASAAVPTASAPPDVAAPPADATKTASGLVMKVVKTGSGTEHPGDNDCVKVEFAGWKRNGTLVTSTRESGEPAVQCLLAVRPAMAEALKAMVVGEQRRIWLPAALT